MTVSIVVIGRCGHLGCGLRMTKCVTRAAFSKVPLVAR